MHPRIIVISATALAALGGAMPTAPQVASSPSGSETSDGLTYGQWLLLNGIRQSAPLPNPPNPGALHEQNNAGGNTKRNAPWPAKWNIGYATSLTPGTPGLFSPSAPFGRDLPGENAKRDALLPAGLAGGNPNRHIAPPSLTPLFGAGAQDVQTIPGQNYKRDASVPLFGYTQPEVAHSL